MLLHTLGGETMGTHWSVRLYAARNADLNTLHAHIQTVLQRVVQQMSTWEPTSTISRFNQLSKGEWLEVPNEFAQVLACALEVAKASDGAFDPTVGSLVELWGFGAHPNENAPTEHAISQMRAHIGWQHIQFDAPRQRIQQPGRMQLDFSAIAKGFACDLVCQHLESNGITSALVDIGGELLAFGNKPDGAPWAVLVEAGPEEDDNSLPPRIIALRGHAVATSGDRFHHYTRDGQQYTHTINPRTGYPIAHAPAAVSVVATSAMHADAWATAMSVLTFEHAFARAKEMGMAVRFLTRQHGQLHETMTDAFAKHIAA